MWVSLISKCYQRWPDLTVCNVAVFEKNVGILMAKISGNATYNVGHQTNIGRRLTLTDDFYDFFSFRDF